MPDNSITRTHAPYVLIKLNPGDIEPKDWAFLRKWAKRLEVSSEVLIERILIAAVIGSHYVEKMPLR